MGLVITLFTLPIRSTSRIVLSDPLQLRAAALSAGNRDTSGGTSNCSFPVQVIIGAGEVHWLSPEVLPLYQPQSLCYGDSGGPAFLVDGKTKARWVVGVNSRGDISTTSYLSCVSTSTAQQFIKDWAQKNDQQICGIHSSAVGCRQSDCTPQPSVYTGPGATIAPGESIFLGGMKIPGQTYLWSPPTGLDYPDVANPLATPTSTTTYTLRVTNECGAAEKTVTIRVSAD